MSEVSQEPNPPVNTIERYGNIATISKTEGKYSIAYGAHILEDKQYIPLGVDGICFEWPRTYPSTHEEVQKVAIVNQKSAVDYAVRNRLPLLAVDCAIAPIISTALMEVFLMSVEPVMASYLYKKMGERVANRGMTRREFVKTVLLGGGVAYLSSTPVSVLGRFGSSLTGIGRDQTAELSKLNQRIHPEYGIFLLRLRDIVAAQKMQYLLQNYDYGHLLAPRGAEHVGMEDAILAQENERMDFLTRLRPVLPQVLSNPETFYQINEYRVSDQGRWEVTKRLEEPRLKQIIGD